MTSCLHAQLTIKDQANLDKLEADARRDLGKAFKDYDAALAKAALKKKAQPTPSLVGEPHATYDKFKDVTTVTTSSPVYHAIQEPRTGPAGKLRGYIVDIDLFATYAYSGQDPTKPSEIALVFKSLADSSFFGRDPSLIVIADSRRFRLGNLSQVLKSYGRLYEEYESISIPTELFAQIANADAVEVQIGNLDFPLSIHNLNTLRRFVGLPIREAPKQALADLAVDDAAALPVAGTSWKGLDLNAEFKLDGTLTFSGKLINRSGTWEQKGDLLLLELPDVDIATVRCIGVGIVKGNRILIRMRAKGLFGAQVFGGIVELGR